MKRFKRLLLYLVMYGEATSMYALSGMGDSMAHAEIDIFAIGLVVCITQLLCYVALKKVKHRKVFAAKRILVKYGSRAANNIWIKGLCAWLMTTFVLSTYLMQLFIPLLFFTIFWAPIVFILYCIVVLRGKWRRKLLTGHKSFIKLLSVFTQQCLGYIAFIVIVPTSLLDFINYNPYPNAYDMDARIYVDVAEGLVQMAEGMLVWGVLFVIPWIVLGISKLVKH